MRFTRYPRHSPYVVTGRKLAYARRAIQRSRDKCPLFPELTDQRSPEQRLEDNERCGRLYWQDMRDTQAAGWRQVRAELATLRPTQRAGLLRYWQTSQMPGSPVYLLGCIHEITSRRVCFWHKLAQRRRLQLIGAGKLPSPWKPQPPHPWDSGKRGPIGTKKAGVPVLLCPHCEAAFYCRPDRDRCPSCGRSPASIPAAPSPTLL